MDIEDDDPLSYSDNYFNLKFELEQLLKRKIDLLEQNAIKNPYLKQQIEKQKSWSMENEIRTWLSDIKQAIEEINLSCPINLSELFLLKPFSYSGTALKGHNIPASGVAR